MTRSDLNLNNLSLAAVAGIPQQFVCDGLPQVAFSGRSNVGKSSLINTLLGRRSLARVSSTPGKTITVNYYDIDGKLYFVDLPGYGFAKRSPEERKRLSGLGDGYYASQKPALTVQLIDIKSGPTADDYTMLDFLRRTEKPYVIAATKCDKIGRTELNKRISDLSEYGQVVEFSSLKGTGRDELWNLIIASAVV
ncbi:MAG: ribosome biogenesis GTP-binding protein YihA/YsxC [Clostridia bacterium]|nr:ribosome biogenesis GTP-binding protein YihA/YsxC [Clostridia bacterium]